MSYTPIRVYGKNTILAILAKRPNDISLLYHIGNDEDVNKTIQKYSNIPQQIVRPEWFDKHIKKASHQYIAADLRTLIKTWTIHDVLEQMPDNIIILDQINDIGNLGAIIRTTANFGVTAIIVTRDNSASVNSMVAKIASGGLEYTNIIYVNNLAQTIRTLQKYQYVCIGLSDSANMSIIDVCSNTNDKYVFCFGAEEVGLRRLTKVTCDYLAYIPNNAEFPVMNIAHAVTSVLTIVQVRDIINIKK